jgi:hypothetical protein
LDKAHATLKDFSLSFLIYLVITFLVHLYQSTGIIGANNRLEDSRNEEAGYTKLNGTRPAGGNGEELEAEAYELAEHESGSSLDEDATKIGGDEVDWMDPDRREARAGRGTGVRI